MDICDSMFSQGYMLVEQIAQLLFDILPERGPIMVLIDRQGKLWLNNAEEFCRLDIDKSFFRALCDKVDDGAEPFITAVKEVGIAAAQLVTERSNLGYVIIVLPRYMPESTLVNIDLVETIFNQTALVAELVEKNNLLKELQMKRCSAYSDNEVPLN